MVRRARGRGSRGLFDVEEDDSARILSEELHDRVDELEIEPVRSHGSFLTRCRCDPEDRRPLEAETACDTRWGEPGDAQAGRRGNDVAERSHRRVPTVLEDEIVEPPFEAVPGGPRGPEFRDGFDDEVPVSHDRIRDED